MLSPGHANSPSGVSNVARKVASSFGGCAVPPSRVSKFSSLSPLLVGHPGIGAVSAVLAQVFSPSGRCRTRISSADRCPHLPPPKRLKAIFPVIGGSSVRISSNQTHWTCDPPPLFKVVPPPPSLVAVAVSVTYPHPTHSRAPPLTMLTAVGLSSMPPSSPPNATAPFFLAFRNVMPALSAKLQ